MNRPSLFLAGVPKSGTSALMNWLGQHPEVIVSRPKEPNYFNPDLPLGLCADEATYLSFFRPRAGKDDEHHSPRRPSRVRCDGSVLYSYSEVAAQRIAEYCPAARVVIVVRDPVDVMHAWHGQMRYTGNEPLADFDDALRAEACRAAGCTRGLVGAAARCPRLLCYRRLVCFAEQIERFYAAVGQDAVLVLTYDDLVAAPQACYAAVLRHAGFDTPTLSSHGSAHFPRMNEFKARRWMGLHRAIKRCAATPARRWLTPFVRQRLIRGWDRLTAVQARRPMLDSELRRRLSAELEGEVARLAKLIGRDLSHWSGAQAASSVSEALT